MLLKWIGVILLVAGVLWLLRRSGQHPAAQSPTPPQALRGQPAARRSGPQTVVACTHCDLHLPVDEAFMGPDGRPYCSEAHRIAHLSDAGRRGPRGA
ncbi:MAG: PP0621 family protein [Pseudomonadota bacterium]